MTKERVCVVEWVDSRKSWYQQKRYVIPACLLLTLAIVGAVIGGVLGSKAKQNANSGGKCTHCI